MKNVVFWDVTSCSSCNNPHFGGMYRLHHQGEKTERAARATRNHSLEDDILPKIMFKYKPKKRRDIGRPLNR
jgi:hypothetical protein